MAELNRWPESKLGKMAPEKSEPRIATAAPEPERWWDFPAALLLMIVLTSAYARLVATRWTSDLDMLRTITYLGMIAGLALGQSRFSGRVAALFSFVYGVFTTAWRIGANMGSEAAWLERLQDLALRLGMIFDHLIQQKPVPDSLLFLLLMCLLFWALSSHAGYTLTRSANPWLSILPTGAALVLIHSYDAYLTRRVWYLVVYLFFALLLVARLVFLQNRRRWQLTKTYMPPHLGIDFIRVTMSLAAILLLLSWAAPARADAFQTAADAWYRIKQPFTHVRDAFDNAFASLSASVGIVNDYYTSTLSLGRGNRLSDIEIFTVLGPSNPPAGVRYYWRARVYDLYEDGQWESTLDVNQSIDPETNRLSFAQYRKRAPGQYSFFFTSALPISTLFTAPQPEWVSRPAKMELLYNPDGTADIGAIRAVPALRSGDSYYVRSSLSGVTVKAMREAGVGYPEWILERYLPLPASITSRTYQLAHDLTDGLPTHYDKVIAITNYLRENMTYLETLESLPYDQELVEWFLFESKQGYCNYYATAEVILLRAVGIPARLAVGYASGEVDEINRAYIVRQRDAHAWPEVYFPDIGWVEFEPTSAQPMLVRPSGESTAASGAVNANPSDKQESPEEPDDLHGPQPLDRGPQGIAAYTPVLLSVLIPLAVLLIAGFMIRRTRVLDRFPPFPVLVEKGFQRVGLKPPAFLDGWIALSKLSPLGRAYQEINLAIHRLGKRSKPNATPAERAAYLCGLLPEAGEPASRLLNEYQSALYGLEPASLPVAQQASHEIRTLSMRALFQRLIAGRSNLPQRPAVVK
ncbi:MAG: transglutaminase-like domain-containing protein [Anaerolineales bacterium]|nr:transglutaminase-like domain-containing protein [Anaerolineales bacterium]